MMKRKIVILLKRKLMLMVKNSRSFGTVVVSNREVHSYPIRLELKCKRKAAK